MSAVFVVSRITDISGQRDFETLAAFSSYETAREQAEIYSPIYNVEISEHELDVFTMVPRESVVVAGSD